MSIGGLGNELFLKRIACEEILAPPLAWYPGSISKVNKTKLSEIMALACIGIMTTVESHKLLVCNKILQEYGVHSEEMEISPQE